MSDLALYKNLMSLGAGVEPCIEAINAQPLEKVKLG